MPDLVFTPPDGSAPGFLRRQKKALKFAKVFNSKDIEPNTIDEIVEFLLDYVTQPEDKDEARELIWNASQNQFMDMVNAISGSADSDENPTGA